MLKKKSLQNFTGRNRMLLQYSAIKTWNYAITLDNFMSHVTYHPYIFYIHAKDDTEHDILKSNYSTVPLPYISFEGCIQWKAISKTSWTSIESSAHQRRVFKAKKAPGGERESCVMRRRFISTMTGHNTCNIFNLDFQKTRTSLLVSWLVEIDLICVQITQIILNGQASNILYALASEKQHPK